MSTERSSLGGLLALNLVLTCNRQLALAQCEDPSAAQESEAVLPPFEPNEKPRRSGRIAHMTSDSELVVRLQARSCRLVLVGYWCLT